MAGIAFGRFVREKRLELGLTLRKFCRNHGYDCGNFSKIERGVFPAPQRRPELERLAQALGLAERSDDWLLFFDLAAVSAGRIPQDILNDEQLASKLPLVFRTISGKPLSEKSLRRLAEVVRRA